jgi:hypothetical protein
MTPKLEYHVLVRRSIPASVALFSLFALPLLLTTLFVAVSPAQINAPPASVTSPGFGGRAVNGPPSSVTSLGPRGYSPSPRVTFSAPPSHISHNSHDGHHRRRNDVGYPPVAYAVPVPYAVDMGAPEEDDADDDANYQGGPTIFDRRGSGADSYVPPMRDVPRHYAAASNDSASADSDPPQEHTLLVFKSGRKVEVGNYAIIGATLFDLTPGHARRVALADLDIDATRKQNDDRGVIFQLPATSQAN